MPTPPSCWVGAPTPPSCGARARRAMHGSPTRRHTGSAVNGAPTTLERCEWSANHQTFESLCAAQTPPRRSGACGELVYRGRDAATDATTRQSGREAAGEAQRAPSPAAVPPDSARDIARCSAIVAPFLARTPMPAARQRGGGARCGWGVMRALCWTIDGHSGTLCDSGHCAYNMHIVFVCVCVCVCRSCRWGGAMRETGKRGRLAAWG